MLLSSVTDERLVAFQWGCVIAASLVAMACDLWSRRIPNVLTLPLLAGGLLLSFGRGGLSSLAEATGACMVLALPYILLFIFAGGGAGDAKLMGAIGAWLGLMQGAVVLGCVAAAGMVLAIGRAIAERRAKVVLSSILVSMYGFMLSLMRCNTIGLTCNLAARDPSGHLEVPYGVAIFAGVCAAGVFLWLW